jgi:hypothetical protein
VTIGQDHDLHDLTDELGYEKAIAVWQQAIGSLDST